MTWSREELARMDEATLLRIVVSLYQVSHPDWSPINASVAADLGCSPQSLANWLGSNGKPGATQLRKLYEASHLKIIRDWMRVQTQLLDRKEIGK